MAATSPVEQTLDETAFQHFAPLLASSQRYAKLSGCRFRSASFDGIPHDWDRTHTSEPIVIGSARHHDSGPRLLAKIKAAPAVNDFKVRLQSGDLGLTNEMERAHSIVMGESVRNAMISTFQALDIYPPAELDTHVDHGDCDYEDLSAPFPVIAQRLYNDQARRARDSIGEQSRVVRQAKTAAFLVDFTSESDVKLPPMPQMQQNILREFAQRTGEFTQPVANQSYHKQLETFLEGLGAGAVSYLLQQEVRQWWTKRPTPNAEQSQQPSADQSQHKLEIFIEDLGAGSAGKLLKQGSRMLSKSWRGVAWTPFSAISAAVVNGSLSQALQEQVLQASDSKASKKKKSKRKCASRD